MRICLTYLNNQTYKNFSILIKNDAGTNKYQDFIKEFPTLKIDYIVNSQNLGAIDNMVSALLYPVKADFIMVMHEDDKLHPNYIQTAINIIENNNFSFVGSKPTFFNPKDNVKITNLKNNYKEYAYDELTRFFINDNNLAFGSIIYSTKDIRPELIDIKKYSELFDRPFLINILKFNKKKCALLMSGFYFYREHGINDNRWNSLKIDNIINLYIFYKNQLNNKYGNLLVRYFFDFAGLKHKNLTITKQFLHGLKRLGLHFNGMEKNALLYFSASIFVLIFGKKNYNKFFIFFKKIKI